MLLFLQQESKEMSLYIFGGITKDFETTEQCKQSMRELCNRLNIGISFDSPEEDDRREIDSAMKSFGHVGAYYSIHDPRHAPDATELWVETRTLGMKLLEEEGISPLVFNLSDLHQIRFPADYFTGILASRLGSFIDGLKRIPTRQILSIALVDGGVERVKTASPEECVKEILQSLILPWDCSPNTLYTLVVEGSTG